MSGFALRLAARAAGDDREGRLRARTAPRFAPATGLAAGERGVGTPWPAVALEEAVASASALAPVDRGSTAPAGGRPRAPGPPATDRVQEPWPPRAPSRGAPAGAPVAGGDPGRAVGAVPSLPATPRGPVIPTPAPPADVSAGEPGRTAPRVVRRAAPLPATPAAVPPPRRSGEPAVPATGAVIRAAPRAPAAVPGTITATPARVEVHIGRVEVSAPRPAADPPPRRAPAAAAVARRGAPSAPGPPFGELTTTRRHVDRIAR